MNYDTTYGDKLYSELVDKNKEYKELHNYIYSNGNFVLLTNSAFISANLKINFIE